MSLRRYWWVLVALLGCVSGVLGFWIGEVLGPHWRVGNTPLECVFNGVSSPFAVLAGLSGHPGERSSRLESRR